MIVSTDQRRHVRATAGDSFAVAAGRDPALTSFTSIITLTTLIITPTRQVERQAQQEQP